MQFCMLSIISLSTYEPSHDKTNNVACSPSEDSDQSLRCALNGDPSFLHADSEDSDQTGRMPRLIWVFAGRTCHFVGFVMSRFKTEIRLKKKM